MGSFCFASQADMPIPAKDRYQSSAVPEAEFDQEGPFPSRQAFLKAGRF
jgi:hypothetical protein